MKPLIRKSWYTLSQAAEYLTQNTEAGLLTVADLLQLAMDGDLSVSLRLTQYGHEGAFVEILRGKQEIDLSTACVVPPGKLVGALDLQGETVLVNSEPFQAHLGVWDIVHQGGGEKLFNFLWDQAQNKGTSSDKLNIDSELEHALTFPGDKFANNIIVTNEDRTLVAAMPLYMIPEGSYLVVRAENLDRLITKPETVDSEMNTKERNILLRLALGMAMKKYDYDPQAERNAATGTKRGCIAEDLSDLGIPVDKKTIKKYLDEAKELLP